MNTIRQRYERLRDKAARARERKDNPDLAALRDRIPIILDTMIKLKKVMAKKGLRACRTNCTVPDCKGIIHATLNGRKDHLHFKCDTCNLMMIE